MMVQVRRNGLFAMAAALILSACAGDAGEDAPADDTDAVTPATPATPAQPTVGANVELPEGVTPEMVAQGEQIFNQQICFSCHGVNGVGTALGPALNDQEWLNTDGTFDDIVNTIRTGVAQPVQFAAPMPAMGGLQLTDEQLRSVAGYVYALSHGS